MPVHHFVTQGMNICLDSSDPCIKMVQPRVNAVKPGIDSMLSGGDSLFAGGGLEALVDHAGQIIKGGNVFVHSPSIANISKRIK